MTTDLSLPHPHPHPLLRRRRSMGRRALGVVTGGRRIRVVRVGPTAARGVGIGWPVLREGAEMLS